ncbi:MAG: HAD family phosphatase [Oscillospiraceae bacterium]|nr:HAD family phosphatase [Oscillospiraceae bacterium]
MKYKLLAADMDGTALNTNKELTPRTAAAMEKAIGQGKTVVFSTGRSISLIKPYIDMVKGMRYAVTASGASVIDLKTGEKLLYETMDAETVKYIIAAAAGCSVMPIIFINDKTYSSSWCIESCADFGLAHYRPIYRIGMTAVEDAFAYFMENPDRVEKLNLFFDNDFEADEVYERIEELPVTFTTRTSSSLEINASGVSKARGLRALCGRLGIELSECIAVGDAENDEEMLSSAGFKIAMANGSDKVKAIADVIAPDCDSEGVASAVEQYFLD